MMLKGTLRFAVTLMVLDAAWLLGVSPLSASVLNMSTATPTTLFYDDFEGLGTAVSHSNYGADAGDYNPVASVGSWVIEEGAPGNIQVTDSVASPDPGTIQGANYLRIHRVTDTGGDNGCADAVFATQSTIGDHIRVEEMVYIPSDAEVTPFYMYLFGSENRAAIALFANGIAANGSIDSLNAQGSVVPTGLSFTAGQWQRWQLDYNIGDPNATFSIDGGAAISFDAYSPGDLAKVYFCRGAIGTESAYVDEVAVPEPCGILMLLSGMIGILAYAWRKRK